MPQAGFKPGDHVITPAGEHARVARTNKRAGRETVIVWYGDGTSRTFNATALRFVDHEEKDPTEQLHDGLDVAVDAARYTLRRLRELRELVGFPEDMTIDGMIKQEAAILNALEQLSGHSGQEEEEKA